MIVTRRSAGEYSRWHLLQSRSDKSSNSILSNLLSDR